ncbi:MAG: TonB-dependent receptor [Bacteroidetes bacterium]|nr:TonB-dependent receptor [Bacteroidota bacterium]
MKHCTLALVSLLVGFSFGNAQTDTLRSYTLNPITVTATRTEVPRTLVAPSISVITQEVLERQPQKSVFSIISQQVPSVFVTERGPIGFGVNSPAGQTLIRGIGGTPNTNVLTLIDGRPQFMGIFGHPVNDSYLSAHIERVEIIRGPASLLYGTNAMGGVINLITAKNDRIGISGKANVTYGTFNTRHAGIRLGYQGNQFSTTASYTNIHTDGHRPYARYTGNSGYLKASYTLSEQYEVSFDGSITKFNTFDPGTITSTKINDWMNIQRGYVGVSLDNTFDQSKGGVRILYNFGHHELSPYYNNNSWTSDDFVSTISAFQTFTLSSTTTFTTGITYDQFGGRGKNTLRNYGYHSVSQYATYLSIQHLFFERLLVNTGIRFDRNEMFGNELTPQLGASYKISDATTVRGFVGKGFRSPTIRELYLFPAPTPSLKPERLWNYEVGASHLVGNCFTADLTLFLQEGSNLIRREGVAPNFRLSNSGKFVHRGVEASGIFLPLDNLQLQGSYSFLEVGNDTRSVPKHKMFANIMYSYSMVSINLAAHHIETMYGSDYKRNKLPDYTVVVIDVSAKLLNNASCSLTIDNVLNETYYTVLGYPMPGRSITVGIQYSL